MAPWKIFIFVGWFVVAAALFTAADSQLIRYAKLGFWVTLGAHAIEFAVFRKTFAKAGGSLAEHFLMTLALGMFHIQSVRAKTEAEGA